MSIKLMILFNAFCKEVLLSHSFTLVNSEHVFNRVQQEKEDEDAARTSELDVRWTAIQKMTPLGRGAVLCTYSLGPKTVI